MSKNIFYIADLHLGHKNVIRFDERPFRNIEEMTETIITNWNRKVSAEDEVYLVGDVVYKSAGHPKLYLSRMNGHKHLIAGNHDWAILKDQTAVDCFESVDKLLQIEDTVAGEKAGVVLCHFPMASWNAQHYGTWHVFGHIHNSIGDTALFMAKQAHSLNAGCMINNYEPVTIEELIENNRTFRINMGLMSSNKEDKV